VVSDGLEDEVMVQVVKGTHDTIPITTTSTATLIR